MILVVTSAEHSYTHKDLEAETETAEMHLVSWDEVLKPPPVRRASYILTDFDRLPPWKLRQASLFYHYLRTQGLPVLNNAGLYLTRPGLLRRLFIRNINQFNAYRVEEGRTPRQWPVFVRAEGDHGDLLSDLLHSPEELHAKVTECVRAGYAYSTLLVIEYAAEEAAPGVFRKFSVFRVGDRFLGYPCVHDDHWVVKHGKSGIAPPEFYEEEYEIVRDNPYGEMLRDAFNQAGLDYGRADFGLVGGRPQIYEINSNPELKLRSEDFSVPRRRDTFALFTSNYLAALKEFDLRD